MPNLSPAEAEKIKEEATSAAEIDFGLADVARRNELINKLLSLLAQREQEIEELKARVRT
jgi:glycine cleavage system regulatory protein